MATLWSQGPTVSVSQNMGGSLTSKCPKVAEGDEAGPSFGLVRPQLEGDWPQEAHGQWRMQHTYRVTTNIEPPPKDPMGKTTEKSCWTKDWRGPIQGLRTRRRVAPSNPQGKVLLHRTKACHSKAELIVVPAKALPIHRINYVG